VISAAESSERSFPAQHTNVWIAQRAAGAELETVIALLIAKSPRQAVRSAVGRAQVIEWLKLLENRSARQDDGPIAEYDFGWMWAELGLQEYRK